MIALYGRLTGIVFVLACALCAAGSMRAGAQPVTAVPENAAKCTTAGAPLGDALNGPHWNGWGIDPSQHRVPALEYGAACSGRRTAPEAEMGLRLPRRGPRVRAADDRGRSPVRRQPERNGVFARCE